MVSLIVEGHTVIPYIYQFARFFNEGLAYVKDDEEKWSFINEEGTMVIPCDKWKGAGDFHEGLAYVVTKNDKWGYIDKSGKNLIPCKWQEADDFLKTMLLLKTRRKVWLYKSTRRDCYSL